MYTHPQAKSRYKASDMQMCVDSDAAYLVSPKSKSRIGGYFCLSKKYNQQNEIPSPLLNGSIHIECQVLKYVVTSAVEAEISGIFLNIKIAIWIRHMLEVLGHPQQIIPIKTDNSIAEESSNSTLKERRSKEWDVRLLDSRLCEY